MTPLTTENLTMPTMEAFVSCPASGLGGAVCREPRHTRGGRARRRAAAAAPDGAEALLQRRGPDGRPGRGSDALARLASLAAQPRTLGRCWSGAAGIPWRWSWRGRSRIRNRHPPVQSRTAAGGWSQQRFARTSRQPGRCPRGSGRRARSADLRGAPDRIPHRAATRAARRSGACRTVLKHYAGLAFVAVPASTRIKGRHRLEVIAESPGLDTQRPKRSGRSTMGNAAQRCARQK